MKISQAFENSNGASELIIYFKHTKKDIHKVQNSLDVLPEESDAYYPLCGSRLAELTLSQRAHMPWKIPGVPQRLSSVYINITKNPA